MDDQLAEACSWKIQELKKQVEMLTKQRDELIRTIGMTYKMLLSEPDTNGALFKAENLLQSALDYAKEGK